MFDLKNRIDFYLRNLIKFSRTDYSELNEPKDEISFSADEKSTEIKLLERYNFYSYKHSSTVVNYCQNLYTLYFLDKYFNVPPKENLRVLDIGSKNWFYAPAQYHYFKSKCNTLVMDGVELDAYRLYSNLYSRYEVAKYYINRLEGANYIAGNLTNIQREYDYIIWILPFVTKYPLRRWGLPDKYFEPEVLFKHALSLLSQNGKMLIINQGEEEFEIQKNLAEGHISYSTELESPFYNYLNKRFLSIIEV